MRSWDATGSFRVKVNLHLWATQEHWTVNAAPHTHQIHWGKMQSNFRQCVKIRSVAAAPPCDVHQGRLAICTAHSAQ